MGEKLSRSDLLLAFMAAPEGSYETDQIRIMKGLFLLEQEKVKPYSSSFAFKAYDYGPFDVGVYGDIESLKSAGLLVEDESGWSRRRRFRVPPAGEARAAEVVEQLGEKSWAKVSEIKFRVTSLSFRDLLKYVYDRYPDFAHHSVARL